MPKLFFFFYCGTNYWLGSRGNYGIALGKGGEGSSKASLVSWGVEGTVNPRENF